MSCETMMMQNDLGASAEPPRAAASGKLGKSPRFEAMPSGLDRSMIPVFVGSCFGWLHPSLADRAGDTAILLCPGLNRDALDAHYSWRLLADALAAANYPTLRFDYPGTGDSGDATGFELEAAEHWSAWQQSIQAAADWLRDATGARRLVFCGLRFGATLATLAAEHRDDVAGLMLLAPILRGHSYMRQLAIEAQLLDGPACVAGGSLEFQELHFSAHTVRLIGQADLRRARLSPGSRVAVFSQSESTLLADCVRAWTGLGAEVAAEGFTGLEPLLHHNVQGEGQQADFSCVLDWLARTFPMQRPASMAPELADRAPVRQVLVQDDRVETPLHFGPHDRLFGMLCQPDRPTSERVVIITSTGVDPHYGFARFGLEFARHLAAAGIASLRIDFAGLGDSLGAPGKEDRVSSLFETDRTADIAAAIDALEGRGYSRFAIQGLCSGAYHALHGALADPRLDLLLLVNMPVFSWRAGDSIDFVGHKHAPSGYLAKLFRAETYRQLLQGRLDVTGILRAQGERLYERAQATARHVARRCGLPVAQGFAHQAMASLSQRGARVVFLFAEEDGGLDVLEQHFGKQGAGLRRFEGASLQTVAGWDHALSGKAMRQQASERMLQVLR